MAVKVDGFNDIFNVMDNLGDVGKRAGKKAIKSGLEEALGQLKKDAPVDKFHSRDKLSIQNIKTNKNGSAWGSCGIGSKNWNDTYQLWYQNYGYENHGLNFTGQHRIENNVGWIDIAYKKVKKKAEDKIMKTLSSELDKLLK